MKPTECLEKAGFGMYTMRVTPVKDEGYTMPRPIMTVRLGTSPQDYKLLLDTGAAKTIFPMAWTKLLKHPNKRGLGPTEIIGIGDPNDGTKESFWHFETITFICNNKKKWKSPLTKVVFSEKLPEDTYGVVGSDFMYSFWETTLLDGTTTDIENWTFSFSPRKMFMVNH